jgi:hypothetical protein
MLIQWTEIGNKCGVGEFIATISEGESLELKGGSVDEELETPIGKSRTYFIKIIVSESDA